MEDIWEVRSINLSSPATMIILVYGFIIYIIVIHICGQSLFQQYYWLTLIIVIVFHLKFHKSMDRFTHACP